MILKEILWESMILPHKSFTVKQIKEFYKKYKFVLIGIYDGTQYELEVAMLSDIPSNISTEKTDKLLSVSFDKRFEHQTAQQYWTSIKTVDRALEHKNNIYYTTFDKWKTAVKEEAEWDGSDNHNGYDDAPKSLVPALISNIDITAGEKICSIDQLRQLFQKYKFVFVDIDDGVAITLLVDIPTDISINKSTALLKAVDNDEPELLRTLTYNWNHISNFESMLDFLGSSTRIEDEYTIKVWQFKDWVKYVKEAYDWENGNETSDFEDE